MDFGRIKSWQMTHRVSVAWISKSINCCCLAGSTVKMLMQRDEFIVFVDGGHRRVE